MAILGQTFPDLLDMYATRDGKGNIESKIIEMLMQTNCILEDIPWMQCNSKDTHKTTMRTGIPEPTWRRFYQGVQPAKSSYTQITDATGMLEARSQIDAALAKISGDVAQFRLNESQGFLEGLSQEVANTLFYGDTAGNPESFLGFTPRFSDKSAQNGQQIIDAGGTTANANTSIWMVSWGENSCHGLYPEGTVGGIERQDAGENSSAIAPDGKLFRAYEEIWNWACGLTVRDWRYVTRIANIDVNNLKDGSKVDLYGFLRKAFYQNKSTLYSPSHKTYSDGNVQGTPSTRTVIYCNRDVMESLDALASNGGTTDNFVRLTPMEIQGKEVLSYRGIPIRVCDALVNTESKVV